VEVAETTVKRLLCCGIQRTGKVMVQVYQCWWRMSRKNCFSFQVRISCFTFYIRDQFTNFPSYIVFQGKVNEMPA
jgi:hypothetical protein